MKLFRVYLLIVCALFGANAQADWQRKYNNLPSCNGKKELLTERFINFDPIWSLDPLGHINPKGGHVFPVHHTYVTPPYIKANETFNPVNIFLPGVATVYAIEKNQRLAGDGGLFFDYKIIFANCKEVRFYFDHLTGLAKGLQDAFDSATSTEIFTSEDGKKQVRLVFLPLTKQALLGHAGGVVKNLDGGDSFDFGVQDDNFVANELKSSRYPIVLADIADNFKGITQPQLDAVYPKKNKAACAIDYFTPALKTYYSTKFGESNRDGVFTSSSANPPCGRVIQDILGTGKGYWFPSADGSVFKLEKSSLAFINDNVNPKKPIISLGENTIIFNRNMLPQQLTYTPAVNTDAVVNPLFENMKIDKVHCFGNLSINEGSVQPMTGIFFAKLGADQLSIEFDGTTSTCPLQPSISTKATVFYR